MLPAVVPSTTEWTDKQRYALWWFSLPEKRRPEDQKSITAMAEFLHISPDTLHAWRSLPGWGSAIFEDARRIVEEHFGDILQSMISQACKGSVQAAKFCFEAGGIRFTGRASSEPSVEQFIVVMPPTIDPAKEALTIEGVSRNVEAG